MNNFSIKIITEGAPELWAQNALDHWCKRLSNFVTVEICPIRGRSARDIIEKTIARLEKPAFALSREGKTLSSPMWAQFVLAQRELSRKMCFVIGGANGIHSEISSQCTNTISLAPITFQHDVALIVLLEQLYRAHSIIEGTPYHRGAHI